MIPFRKVIGITYLIVITSLAALFIKNIGTDVLPRTNSSQFQLRIRAPYGTRLERTEEKVRTLLSEIDSIVGKEHVSITSVYVGQHPALFSINPIYLFMAGPHEAVFQVALKDYDGDTNEFKDRLRARSKELLPDVKLSFEPIELTEKVLSQGSPTPVEVRIVGKNKPQNEEYGNKIVAELNKISYFRDVQIAQPLEYPSLDIDIDRTRATQ